MKLLPPWQSLFTLDLYSNPPFIFQVQWQHYPVTAIVDFACTAAVVSAFEQQALSHESSSCHLQVQGKRLFQTPSSAGGTESKVSPTDPFACSRVVPESVPFPGFGGAVAQGSPAGASFSFQSGMLAIVHCCSNPTHINGSGVQEYHSD